VIFCGRELSGVLCRFRRQQRQKLRCAGRQDWKKGNDVATDKETAERILVCLSAVVDARIKPMFGEYGVYADEKMIG